MSLSGPKLTTESKDAPLQEFCGLVIPGVYMLLTLLVWQGSHNRS